MPHKRSQSITSEDTPAQRREVLAVGVGHGGQEVVARHCLAVVTLEVGVHPLSETRLAQDRVIQPHHF